MTERDNKGRFVKGHKVPKQWGDSYRKKANWQKGNECYNWKEITYENGYRFVKVNGKKIREHDYIFLRDNDLGLLSIPKGWIVHHKDEDKLNNHINNLTCLPRDYHLRMHNPLASRWT